MKLYIARLEGHVLVKIPPNNTLLVCLGIELSHILHVNVIVLLLVLTILQDEVTHATLPRPCQLTLFFWGLVIPAQVGENLPTWCLDLLLRVFGSR